MNNKIVPFHPNQTSDYAICETVHYVNRSFSVKKYIQASREAILSSKYTNENKIFFEAWCLLKKIQELSVCGHEIVFLTIW